jgi:hypothetical protein
VNVLERINSHRYLFLTEISEPEDNALRLIVTEGRLGEEVTEGLEGLGRIAEGSRAIVADEQSARYEILFEHYIAYAVLNESITVWDDEQTFEGKLFRVYSESKFLTYVASGTIANNDYPGPFRHYGIACQNHVVEVASTQPPLVTVLR